MSVESRLQTKIRNHLKSLGCDVLVIKPQPGIPDGWEDIMFFRGTKWGTLEVKKDPNAEYQPLQEERIARHNEWSFARRVDPTDWNVIKIEVEMFLYDNLSRS